jgi:hypothetical protein
MSISGFTLHREHRFLTMMVSFNLTRYGARSLSLALAGSMLLESSGFYSNSQCRQLYSFRYDKLTTGRELHDGTCMPTAGLVIGAMIRVRD